MPDENEVHAHDEKDDSETWVAFVPGCPYCQYRMRYWKLNQVRQRVDNLDPNSVEFEPLLNHVINETQSLLDFSLAICEESDKAKRRMREAVWN